MILDPNPKTRRGDLYGRERELKELLASEKERLVVIAAPRRMGKTSLLNVYLVSTTLPSVKVDGRELHLRGVTSYNLLRVLAEELARYEDLTSFLGLREGFDFKRASVLDLFKKLNGYAGSRKKRFIIAIDEAQYLRFGKKLDVLLAYGLDNLPNILFILTGSEVGVLHDFLGTDKPDSPLFGRRIKPVGLGRFEREKALDFLKKGLREMKVKYEIRDLEKAVDKLDGIVGWLTHFGYSHATEKAPLESFVEKAKGMVKKELEKLYEKSDRYRMILEAVAKGFRKWSEIYEYLAIRIGPISRSNFNYLLEGLLKMNFLEKIEGRYAIPDPMIEEAAKG